MWNASADVVEIRVPYTSIGFSDPSSMRALVVNPRDPETITSRQVDAIRFTFLAGGAVAGTARYAWEPWQSVRYRERMKAGAARLAATARGLDRVARERNP